MKIVTFFIFSLLLVLFQLAGRAQQSVTIVPYPKQVTLNTGFLSLKDGFSIAYDRDELSPVADLLIEDLYRLYQFSGRKNKGSVGISLAYDSLLSEEEYTITINGKKVRIDGGSYHAVCMGATSLLQLAVLDGKELKFPQGSIMDEPVSGYRGVMIDVARQWHSIETLEQVVQLCRWYKIRYLQLHLSDDQSFTFPSGAYPKLATEGRHYTVNQLKGLVEFARKRGVIIVPEFDAPGHTTAIRKQMPELFGEPDLGMINIADEKVYKAMETIMKEMMDIFYTSPYFHIGGDEVWLEAFEKEQQTKDYLKERGFDNAHDIYLDFLVRMHGIVKKYHKKTLLWESFSGTGSNKVSIPKDLIVMAWETAYQRPDSLLHNGYSIINASWKPVYVTPGLRWASEYIYNWNIRRWENHWNAAPSYQHPIQLGNNDPVLGGQLCSWEMSEDQEIPSLHQRIPAFSEVVWNDQKKDYNDFRERYVVTDRKFNRLIFPVSVYKEGFTNPAYEGIYYNRENQFGDKATILFKPLLPGTKITYTTDEKKPGIHSPELPGILNINKDFRAQLAVFNKNGEKIGFQIVHYELNPMIAKVEGNMLALRDTNTQRQRTEFIGSVRLSFNNLKKGSVIRYTTDGKTPTRTSLSYSNYIQVDQSETVKAICFYNQVPFGRMYESQFIKKDYEKNITTGKKIFSPNGKTDEGRNITKAVDGFADPEAFWDSGDKPASIIIDLGNTTPINRLSLYTYWGDKRFYTYEVEFSLDGRNWEKVVDRTGNTEIATKDGYRDEFPLRNTRFIKVDMLSNSANKSMHIVEIRAY